MHPNTAHRLQQVAKTECAFATYRGCEIYRAPLSARPFVWELHQARDSFATLDEAMADIDRALGHGLWAERALKPDHRLLMASIAILAVVAVVALAGCV